METAYALLLRSFDLLLSKKRFFFVLGGLGVFLVLSAIALFILQKFPNSADEHAYLYQARTFLAGRLWNPAHPLPFFFESYNILNENGRVFGQYLPGWPLLLAAGMALKIPSYLMGPLLGTLSLAALFLLGKKIYSERVALLAVSLTFLSSFFLFNSASYFSHVPCSLILVLFVYFSLRFKDTLKISEGLLTGFLFAAAFLTRPYSAFLTGLPVTLYLLPDLFKAPRKILFLLTGALPLFVLLLGYSFELTGNPFLLPPMLVEGNLNWGATLAQTERLTRYLKDLFEWMPVSFPVLYVFYLFTGLAGRKNFAPQKMLLGSFFITSIAGYFFYNTPSGNSYGPRYYYEAFPFLVLFITGSLFKEPSYGQKSLLGKCLFLFLLVSLPLSVPRMVEHARTIHATIWERTDPYRRVEHHGIQNAIVFIRTGAGKIRPMPAKDLIRNDPDYQNSVLYALDYGEGDLELMRFYPKRTYYWYYYDKSVRRGFLIPLLPFQKSS